MRGDLEKAFQQLKRESGKGLLVGGVKLPQALSELGLIDGYEFVMSSWIPDDRTRLLSSLKTPKKPEIDPICRL
jgi:hypothetical protein